MIYNEMGKKRKPENDFTTVRVSKEFVDRVSNLRITESFEDALRRLLSWEPLKKKPSEVSESQ
jgi:hypothetical protein